MNLDCSSLPRAMRRAAQSPINEFISLLDVIAGARSLGVESGTGGRLVLGAPRRRR